jgi:nucleoside phosphorylase
VTEEITLVCFAVKEEANAFRRTVADRGGIETLLTGMGRRNADRAIRQALTQGRPAMVLSCGFAGGLNPKLASGKVVFAVEGNPPLESDLLKAGATKARIHCAERVAATAAEKRALREASGADAVEMESEVIGAVCAKHKIPFATVRVILDTADEDLPLDFNDLMTPDQRMDYAKLAVALLKSPGKTVALLKLQTRSTAAAEELARVLASIIPFCPQHR